MRIAHFTGTNISYIVARRALTIISID